MRHRTPRGYYSYFANQLAPYGPAATDPTRGYYSYDIGAWHVSVLNTTCYTSSIGCDRNLMEQWFADDLNANPANCTLAIWHQPRFSSGNVHGNNAQMQALWQTAYEHGVDLVLSGHEHDYERFAPMDAVGNADPVNGTREIVVGKWRLLPLRARHPAAEQRGLQLQHVGRAQVDAACRELQLAVPARGRRVVHRLGIHGLPRDSSSAPGWSPDGSLTEHRDVERAGDHPERCHSRLERRRAICSSRLPRT